MFLYFSFAPFENYLLTTSDAKHEMLESVNWAEIYILRLVQGCTEQTYTVSTL